MTRVPLGTPSRRALVRGGLGLLALGAGAASLRTIVASHDLHLETRAGVAFGTTVTLMVAGPDAAHLRAALDDGFKTIRAVESASSVYRPDSEIAQLNRAGVLSDPSADLLKLLRYGLRLSAETQGLFDVTVQPLWDYWSSTHAVGRRPTPTDLRPILDLIDWRGISVAEDRIRLLRPSMAITLNSINQGYAADRVLAMLRERGIEHAFVDTGEFGASGRHPDGRPWRLGIADPRADGRLISTIDPFSAFAATSGDYKTYFSPDFVDHHIFVPLIGYSPSDWSSITVSAPSGLEADGLSTALFLMDEAMGRDLLSMHPACTALVVPKRGRSAYWLSSVPLALAQSGKS